MADEEDVGQGTATEQEPEDGWTELDEGPEAEEQPAEEPAEEPAAEPAGAQQAASVYDPDSPFNERELEVLAELMDSGDVANQIKAQQIIARRTLQVEQESTWKAEQAMAELGVTPEFKGAYAVELGQAMQQAHPRLKTTKEGAALLVSAAIAQRAISNGKSLADALGEAAALMGGKPAARKAEVGLKPPEQRDVRAQAGPGGGRTGRVSLDTKLREVFGE